MLLRSGGSLLSVLLVLLNLMQVRGLDSRFVQFYDGYVAAATGSLQNRTAPPDRLWPMGLPFPEVELAAVPIAGSRRRQQRWLETRQYRRLLNSMVTA